MPKSTLRRIIDELPGAAGSASGRAPGSASSSILRAANVLFTAYRTIVASNVQRAIELLEDQKLNLTGGYMSGGLYLVDDPVEDDEAATKRYVDTYMAAPNEGTTALRVDNLAGVPFFHAVHETEAGRIGIPTNAGITWDNTSVRIGGVIVNGPLSFVGPGRPVREARVEVARLTPGSSSPTATTRAAGASGSVVVPVMRFSKTVEQDVNFIFHPENGIDATYACAFHIMWIPGASFSSGNVMWKIDYLVKNENDSAVNTGTPTTIQANVTPSSAVNTIETEFATTFTIAASQIAFVRLYRDVANDNGDDVADLMFVEVEYALVALGEVP